MLHPEAGVMESSESEAVPSHCTLPPPLLSTTTQ